MHHNGNGVRFVQALLGSKDSTKLSTTSDLESNRPGMQMSAISAWRVCICCIAVHTVLLVWQASKNSPTIDEPGHLVAGVSYLEYWDFDLYSVNPPLTKMIAAIPSRFMDLKFDWHHWDRAIGARPEGSVGRDFFYANGTKASDCLFAARLMMLPFSWLGAAGCYYLATKLYGRLAGCAALIFWCCCPTILAHGSLLTSDMPAAAISIWVIWFGFLITDHPTLNRAMCWGLCIGTALLCKFSVGLIVGITLIFFILTMSKRRQLTRGVLLSLAALSIAIWIINLGYLFKNSFQPLSSHQFVSNRFLEIQSILPGWLTVPFPREMLKGADLQNRDFENGLHAYLLGSTSERGFYSYYLFAVLFKIPTTTLAALGLATFCLRLKGKEWLLLIIPVTLLLVASVNSSLNIGIRYLLPAFPCMFVFASRSLLAGRRVRFLAVTLLLGTVLDSAFAAPRWIAYFSPVSRLVGTPENLLADSNLDWGQDLYRLRDWWRSKDSHQPLNLAYFGPLDVHWAGIEHRLPPREDRATTKIGRNHPQLKSLEPGLYAISTNFLFAFTPSDWKDLIGFAGSDSPGLAYFRSLQPVEIIGDSIFVYELTEVDCSRLNRELGF